MPDALCSGFLCEAYGLILQYSDAYYNFFFNNNIPDIAVVTPIPATRTFPSAPTYPSGITSDLTIYATVIVTLFISISSSLYILCAHAQSGQDTSRRSRHNSSSTSLSRSTMLLILFGVIIIIFASLTLNSTAVTSLLYTLLATNPLEFISSIIEYYVSVWRSATKLPYLRWLPPIIRFLDDCTRLHGAYLQIMVILGYLGLLDHRKDTDVRTLKTLPTPGHGLKKAKRHVSVQVQVDATTAREALHGLKAKEGANQSTSVADGLSSHNIVSVPSTSQPTPQTDVASDPSPKVPPEDVSSVKDTAQADDPLLQSSVNRASQFEEPFPDNEHRSDVEVESSEGLTTPTPSRGPDTAVTVRPTSSTTTISAIEVPINVLPPNDNSNNPETGSSEVAAHSEYLPMQSLSPLGTISGSVSLLSQVDLDSSDEESINSSADSSSATLNDPEPTIYAKDNQQAHIRELDDELDADFERSLNINYDDPNALGVEFQDENIPPPFAPFDSPRHSEHAASANTSPAVVLARDPQGVIGSGNVSVLGPPPGIPHPVRGAYGPPPGIFTPPNLHNAVAPTGEYLYPTLGVFGPQYAGGYPLGNGTLPIPAIQHVQNQVPPSVDLATSSSEQADERDYPERGADFSSQAPDTFPSAGLPHPNSNLPTVSSNDYEEDEEEADELTLENDYPDIEEGPLASHGSSTSFISEDQDTQQMDGSEADDFADNDEDPILSNRADDTDQNQHGEISPATTNNNAANAIITTHVPPSLSPSPLMLPQTFHFSVVPNGVAKNPFAFGVSSGPQVNEASTSTGQSVAKGKNVQPPVNLVDVGNNGPAGSGFNFSFAQNDYPDGPKGLFGFGQPPQAPRLIKKLKTPRVKREQDEAEVERREESEPKRMRQVEAGEYERLELMNSGTCADVFKARDVITGKVVALKCFHDTPAARYSGEVEVHWHKRLKELNRGGSQFIPEFIAAVDDGIHIQIFMELLGPDLSVLINKLRKKKVYLNLEDIRKIAHHCVQELAFFHQNHIIHCDIKPENIAFVARDLAYHEMYESTTEDGETRQYVLLRSTDLYIFDFNMMCEEFSGSSRQNGTLDLNPPEVHFGLESSYPRDPWSLGATLCELFHLSPPFSLELDNCQPEVVNFTMLKFMESVLGAFPKDLLPEWQADEYEKFEFTPDAALVERGEELQEFLNSGTEFSDFLSRLLTMDPEERMTMSQALEHPWIKDLTQ
ncbi:unnamed protein product [Somion occarium]|uniref:Protein kinase domain-containing protein n=1 Tax=Somion occarium TaxID=3059160 RepID=A0ABP1E2U7_9APHY